MTDAPANNTQLLTDGGASLPAGLYSAFVGPKWDYYAPRFEKYHAAGERHRFLGLNWFALVFPTYWLFYRKMYLWGLLGLLGTHLLASATGSPIFVWILWGVLVSVYGVFAYYRHAREKIEPLQELEEQNGMAQAARLGGTSWILVAILLVIDLGWWFLPLLTALPLLVTSPQ